ncbi:TnsA endonuclease N-terminal domain-containing protein [Stenotrophomonas sepilia]|uniref:TnsA endonuclease N-terminal domain-containing protein n=1 Tax=Stenotrophomonas sepilia TaxID=2860290 RepID=UPI00131205BA|nr:TnsA endonuclease N-terminal domain-containing protein [Stenotrophomonas maltophilia]
MSAKVLQPAGKGGDTEFNFDPSDATGFPRRLPPARKIGLGRRALTGLIPSSKLGEGASARFESSLERDFFALLEFSNDVAGWDPQPVQIKVPSGRPYVPDVLVHWLGPDRSLAGGQRILYEVKYREELRRKWNELLPRYRAATRYARERGWKFRVVTEDRIRTDALFNAKFLLPYLNDPPNSQDALQLLHAIEVLRETTPSLLLESCSGDPWVRGRLVATLWRLVADRTIAADLTCKLTMNSVIWCDC